MYALPGHFLGMSDDSRRLPACHNYANDFLACPRIHVLVCPTIERMCLNMPHTSLISLAIKRNEDIPCQNSSKLPLTLAKLVIPLPKQLQVTSSHVPTIATHVFEFISIAAQLQHQREFKTFS